MVNMANVNIKKSFVFIHAPDENMLTNQFEKDLEFIKRNRVGAKGCSIKYEMEIND